MSAVIRLHPNDDVVIARSKLVSGTAIENERITVKGLIPPGHKIATRAIEAGQPVRRYNQVIGFAKQRIEPGQHVHLHNLGMGDEGGAFERDYAIGQGVLPIPPAQERRTFKGIVRPDGRIATRNYLATLTSVNCSATVARAIAAQFDRMTHPDALARFPNVDGVVALTTGSGCGMDHARI